MKGCGFDSRPVHSAVHPFGVGKLRSTRLLSHTVRLGVVPDPTRKKWTQGWDWPPQTTQMILLRIGLIKPRAKRKMGTCAMSTTGVKA